MSLFGSVQGGASLLELISIITILGVTSAAAAPKLTALSDAAHQAKLDGAAAAIHSAAMMAHADWLVGGKLSGHVEFEGDQVEMENGWPVAAHIPLAAGIDCAQYGCFLQGKSIVITPHLQPNESSPCLRYSNTNGKRYVLSNTLRWNQTEQRCL